MQGIESRMRQVEIPVNGIRLQGFLTVPENAIGVVLFAHGSGSSRHSSRNQFVAAELNQSGLATLLFDLLTADEGGEDLHIRELRFNIPLLAERLVLAVDWVQQQKDLKHLHVGLFGASTGAAAALIAAVAQPHNIAAVVCRGGRPDLASTDLASVEAPTLLIVGGQDFSVLRLNKAASAHMLAEHETMIVPGATHLFEEPDKLAEVAQLARDWFCKYLSPRRLER